MTKILAFLKKNDISYLLIFTIIAAFFYFPSLQNLNFFWDDDRFIYGNPDFIQAPSWLSFWDIRSTYYKSWSLGYSIFWWIIKVFPSNSFLFVKVLNILLHAFNAFLVFKITNQVKIRGSFLIALLFLVHPLNVESVSWFFQFLTILSFTFFAISVYFLLKHDQKNRNRNLLYSILFYAFSLLTKSIAVLAPFLLFFYFISSEEKPRKKLFHIFPIFIIAILVGILNVSGIYDISNQKNFVSSTSSTIVHNLKNVLPPISEKTEKDIDPTQRGYFEFIYKNPELKNDQGLEKDFDSKSIFSQSLYHYSQKIIFPINLQYIYPTIQYPIAIPILVVIFFLFWGYLLTSIYPKKHVIVSFAYIVLLLTPYLGITYITFFYWSPVSDRYTYFILPAFIFLITITINMIKNDKIKQVIFYSYILFLSFTTIEYTKKFNTPQLLYSEILEYKKHPVIYSLLFEEYLQKLELDKAEKILTEAISLYPEDPHLKINLMRLNGLIKNYIP